MRGWAASRFTTDGVRLHVFAADQQVLGDNPVPASPPSKPPKRGLGGHVEKKRIVL
jgi:hypothetical protein